MALQGSPSTYELEILTALGTGDFKSAVATTKMRLFKNNLVPGPGSKFADFVEADFTGYTAVTISAWGSPPLLDAVDNRYFIYPATPPLPTFTQTATTISNTIYGFYLEDGSSKLIMFQRFDTPVEMDTALKTLTLFNKVNAMGLEGPDALED